MKTARMTKAQRKAEGILRQGLALRRLFGGTNLLPGPTKLSGVALYKALHRLETRAHHYAEQECNEDIPEAITEKRDKAILDAVDKLLHFRVQNIPVILNGDPRGYALKIEADWMRSHRDSWLHTDWGGYGILAPEFD